ncbi:MAG: nitrogen regulation protein NR(II) [Pseudomonadales bacterium]|nr:nitrogen regulation protein NR(II) [Pseudomonadales bacterium]
MNTEHLNTRLIDNLTTAIIVLDAELRLFHLNPAAEALLETSDRHCHNAYVGDILCVAGDTLESMRNAQLSGSTYIARKEQLTLAGGNRLIVDYAVSPLHDIGENFLLIEIQGLDRSYQISRKETFLSNHETTRELVRGLGHEIKNPLGGIRGAAQLLAQELNNKELQDYTSIIIKETDRLVKLVDGLTGGYQKPRLKLMNIHEVLERTRNLVEAETRGRIVFIRDYDPSIPEFMGDVEQLIQAVLNITRNAMQALSETDMKRVKPRITLKSRAVSQATIGSQIHKLVARIEITDNGPGIDPAIIDNIFYPLISGRAEGTGLGLSIAQTIVHNHDGLIECESQPGRTRFIVSIPLQQTEGTE